MQTKLGSKRDDLRFQGNHLDCDDLEQFMKTSVGTVDVEDLPRKRDSVEMVWCAARKHMECHQSGWE